jgi:hypothetical protein
MEFMMRLYNAKRAATEVFNPASRLPGREDFQMKVSGFRNIKGLFGDIPCKIPGEA